MIVVVSGLPRSGTSMMMQMLEAGGMPVLTDNLRKADDDNPRGYLELEKAKGIKRDASWLAEAEGKVFKMVAMLLYHLPADHQYKIILMKRDLTEMLKSQTTMLRNRGKDGRGPTDAEMGLLFQEHLKKITSWLANQKNMEVLYCEYAAVVKEPRKEAQRIADFLGTKLNVDKMTRVVDPTLYREKENIK
jgi:hypothetical protein